MSGRSDTADDRSAAEVGPVRSRATIAAAPIAARESVASKASGLASSRSEREVVIGADVDAAVGICLMPQVTRNRA
jgi:hypothetical protein